MAKSKLIGKIVDILDANGRPTCEWGTIIDFDGEYFHIAFANDPNCVPIYSRDEFRVVRDQEGRRKLIGG